MNGELLVVLCYPIIPKITIASVILVIEITRQLLF